MVPGVAHTFRVVYRPEAHYFSAYDDGILFSSSPFDPFAHWTQPFGWQILGETLHKEDNQPGVTAAPVQYYNVLWQRRSDGSFTSGYPGPALDLNSSTAWDYDPIHITSCCGKAMATWTVR